MTFKNLPATASKILAKLSMDVLSTQPEEVNTWDFIPPKRGIRQEPRFVAEIREWAKKAPCIYFIEVVNASEVDLKRALSAFSRSKKKNNGKKAFAKENTECSCLYVGGSKSLALRTKQHLGMSESKKTYSLQLSLWASGLGMNLRIHCARYEVETDPIVVQALEDALWDEKEPMFGKRGAR
jgi:hypothetical protein